MILFAQEKSDSIARRKSFEGLYIATMNKAISCLGTRYLNYYMMVLFKRAIFLFSKGKRLFLISRKTFIFKTTFFNKKRGKLIGSFK